MVFGRRVEVIEVVTKMVDNISGAMKIVDKTVTNLGYGVEKTKEQITGFDRAGNILNRTMTRSTKGLKRFKFEWLGVMFAGMALYRVFGGLIRRQLELFGVMEMLSATMTVTFLPLMEILTPLLFILLEAFMNLSEPVQLLIGIFVLLAAGIGGVMFVVGQIMLGFHSMLLLFPTLGTAILKAGGVWKLLGVIVSGITAPMIIVVGIIIALVVGMYIAWKKNFLGMKKTVSNFIDGVKRFFNGFINVIKGIMLIVKGIFTGDFELVKEGIVKIFKGLWDMITGGFKATFNGVVAIVKGALMIVYNLIKVIVDGILWVADKTTKFFGGEGIEFRMPSFQRGGVVPSTGPYLLHRGETVIPANNTFTPSIIINAKVSSDIDIRDLAGKVSKIWVSEFDRLNKTRSL